MTFRRLLATTAAVASLVLPAAVFADAPNDAFIAGYAAAVMERELAIKADGLSVRDGRITVVRPPLAPAEKAQLIKILSVVPGVKDVTIVDDATVTLPAGPPMEKITVGPSTAPSGAASSGPARTGDAKSGDAADEALTVRTGVEPLTLHIGFGRTFAPLQADPRWPHFYASFQQYSRDTGPADLESVASVGFGETIAMVKESYPSGFRWEGGLQAGLFAIFDMNSDSKDLINADYFIGPYFAFRKDNLSILTRIYHQSSHLGDEYILRDDAEPRVNYTFEELNVIASYDLPKGFRVYGGAGYRIDTEPDIDPWRLQYGVEWLSPDRAFGLPWLRPLAALDVQHHEEDDWAFSWSLRAGFQFEDPSRFAQRLQLLLEYYDGNSRNGQFYEDHIRYLGIGFHFYF